MAPPMPSNPNDIPDRMALILALTLDGRSVDTIVKYLRQDQIWSKKAHKDKDLKQAILGIRQGIRNMSSTHEHPDEPEDAAEEIIAKMVDWCMKDGNSGLSILARSKEFDAVGGDQMRLATAARRRMQMGADVATDLGYTEEWLLGGESNTSPAASMFKHRLLRYWSTGTIEGPDFDRKLRYTYPLTEQIPSEEQKNNSEVNFGALTACISTKSRTT